MRTTARQVHDNQTTVTSGNLAGRFHRHVLRGRCQSFEFDVGGLDAAFCGSNVHEVVFSTPYDFCQVCHVQTCAKLTEVKCSRICC